MGCGLNTMNAFSVFFFLLSENAFIIKARKKLSKILKKSGICCFFFSRGFVFSYSWYCLLVQNSFSFFLVSSLA